MQSWLCPSDRQLRLRACIARGWSTPRSAVAALTSAECAAISDVLRRDRALRLLDWGRVDRVANQVERLRLAQCGDGHASCRLCGRRLRHRWWRPSGLCDDCGFRFCDSCAGPLPEVGFSMNSTDEEQDHKLQHSQHREAWLCRLCRESRILTAKSGAWFHHRVCESLVSPLDDSELQPGSLLEPANQKSPLSPEEVTSSHDSLRRRINSTNQSQWQQPANPSVDTRGRKFRSHGDLHSQPGPAEHLLRQVAGGEASNSKLHRSRNMAIIRRRKSASCSQICHEAQCEYFPTELVDE